MTEKVKLKIAISGAQGTGKTTTMFQIAADCKIRYPGHTVGVLHEVARGCPWPINQQTTPKSQMWIFVKQMEEEQRMMEKYDIVVCDRTVMDSVAHTDIADGMEKLADMMLPEAQEWCKTYSTIYFKSVRDNRFNNEDGLRDTDTKYRDKVDKTLRLLYNVCGINIIDYREGGEDLRGTIAKKIRKAVYGTDMSRKVKRFGWGSNNGIVNVGLRATYQKLKSMYKKGEMIFA